MKFDGLREPNVQQNLAHNHRVELIRLDVTGIHITFCPRDHLMSLQEFSATKNTRLCKGKNEKNFQLPSIKNATLHIRLKHPNF